MKTIPFLVLLIATLGCAGGGGSTGGGAFDVPQLPTKTETSSASVTGSDSVFVGYDDTGSTALVQLMKYEIKNDRSVDSELAQPHELLNAEEFTSDNMVAIGPFEISIGMLQSESKENGKTLYDLGVHLKGPTTTTDSRPNFVLTYCIDVSGSMDEDTGAGDLTSKSKLALVKSGLTSAIQQLKAGDFVNIVLFANDTNIYVENYIHSVSDESTLRSKINAIQAEGSTNLEAGLKKAYEVATRYYDSEKKNRVLLITDAMANVGSTDPSLIARNIVINNKEGILMSGLGIGINYDAAFLEELTDAGAGNQFLVATDADAENIFSDGLLPLLMLAAKDMKVEIVYPSSISHIASAAEQVAETAEDLKGINFSYNASQYYLERFKTDLETDVSASEITINITYLDPVTSKKLTASKTFVIADILNNESSNIKDALTMIFLTSLIKETKTWDDLTYEFTHVLNGHSSTLFTEYKSLIYQFADKEDLDTF